MEAYSAARANRDVRLIDDAERPSPPRAPPPARAPPDHPSTEAASTLAGRWLRLCFRLSTPSIMVWKHRGFMLGPHCDSGEIAFEAFDDVGSEALDAIPERAESLSNTLRDVRLKARGRRWTPSKNRLRA